MTTAADVVARAASQNGYAETPPGSNRTIYGEWYGMDGAAWCAMFVSWVFWNAELALPASTRKGFAYTPAGAAWFQQHDWWVAKGQGQPQVGDVVFYWMPKGPARINHVGIVSKVNADGTIHAWEGNTDVRGGRTGGRVLQQHRALTHVVGFGRPPYANIPPHPGGDDVPHPLDITKAHEWPAAPGGYIEQSYEGGLYSYKANGEASNGHDGPPIFKGYNLHPEWHAGGPRGFYDFDIALDANGQPVSVVQVSTKPGQLYDIHPER